MVSSLARLSATAACAVLSFWNPLSHLGVDASEELRVISPDSAVGHYTYFPGKPGVIREKPALFGIPNYQHSITGGLFYASPNDGCTPINRTAMGLPPVTDVNINVEIALIDRGVCAFQTKVKNAQNAGFLSAIVADNVENAARIPYMAGDGKEVIIPSVIIFKEDGDKLKSDIQTAQAAGQSLVVSITYSLPNPDNRVEWDLWTTSYDPASQSFKQSITSYVKQLGDAALFTPYMYTMQGWGRGCKPSVDHPTAEQLPCRTQCSNNGRYCATDPDKDVNKGLSGRDIVQESLRQKCLWNVTQAAVPQIPQYKWFDYVTKFQATCNSSCAQLPSDPNVNPDCSNGWSEQCSYIAMDAVFSGNSISTQVKKCVSDSGGYGATDGENTMLEDEIKSMVEYGIFTVPTLFVNKQPFSGSLACDDSTRKCGPISAICAGYKLGTAPAVCSAVDFGCKPGQLIDGCGQCEIPTSDRFNSSCKGCDGVLHSGKVYDACNVCDGPGTRMGGCLSTGSIVAIFLVVILFAVGVVVGGWWYLRRQTRTMRDDVDSLLKQYLPLEGTNGREHIHTHDKQRLIDEGTDI